MTQETHSEALELLANKETYRRIWQSDPEGKWNWVVQFPNETIHNYSGTADTLERAKLDTVLSAEHYVLTRGGRSPL